MNIKPLKQVLHSASIFTDGDWVESKDQDPEGNVRLIQLADIGDGVYINKSNRFLTSDKAKELRCTFLEEGDVLIARMPDPLGRACIFPGDEKLAVTVVDVCVVRSDVSELHPRYLMHWLNSPSCKPMLLAKATGATRQRISRSNLGKIGIPIPDFLSEQHRIVEILDQADKLRQQHRKADDLSQRIVPAMFHEMFGDPNRNERGWPIQSLEEAFDDVSRKGNKIPRSEYLEFGAIPIIDQGQDEISGYWNEVGDAYRGDLPVVLFGDHTRIFKLLENPFCIGADGVRLLRPKSMNCPFAFGLLTLLNVPSRGYSRHFKELRSLSYISPPSDLQKKFGKALVEQRKYYARTATSAKALDALFQTLLHRAFDGSLTAKWREGHAKELLEEMNHQARA